jgi:hypothetical protein
MVGEGDVMHHDDDGEGARYSRGFRLILLIVLLLHVLAVLYALGRRLSEIDPHRIYDPAMGLRSSPQPGIF